MRGTWSKLRRPRKYVLSIGLRIVCIRISRILLCVYPPRQTYPSLKGSDRRRPLPIKKSRILYILVLGPACVRFGYMVRYIDTSSSYRRLSKSNPPARVNNLTITTNDLFKRICQVVRCKCASGRLRSRYLGVCGEQST